MADDERARARLEDLWEPFAEPERDKASPAVILGWSAAVSLSLLAFGITWILTGDGKWGLIGAVTVVAATLLAAGLAAAQNARRK